jgi:hypothetical protein
MELDKLAFIKQSIITYHAWIQKCCRYSELQRGGKTDVDFNRRITNEIEEMKLTMVSKWLKFYIMNYPPYS